MKYTEGICGEGAAILKDGVMLSIPEILSELNRLEERDEIDYKFINYERNDDGIDLWVTDNPPIHLNDDYELSNLADQLQLIKTEVWEKPF